MCFAFSLAGNNCPSYSGRCYHHVTVEISISATKEATLTMCPLYECTYGQGWPPPCNCTSEVK